MALATLPSDILYNTFILLDDLHDLHAVVSAGRSLHNAFQDQRVCILKHVFSNQVLQHCEIPFLDSNEKPSLRRGARAVDNVKHTLARCKQTRDKLTLEIAAWNLFQYFQSQSWLFSSFPSDLVDTCEALNRPDLALSYTVTIWNLIGVGNDNEVPTPLDKNPTSVWGKLWTEKLAEKYHEQCQTQDAIAVILKWYSSMTDCHCWQMLAHLRRYATKLEDQVKILSYFKRRVEGEQENLLQFLRGRASYACTHTWFFAYIDMLVAFQKFGGIVDAYDRLFDIFTPYHQNPNDIIARSRQVIHALMNRDQYNVADFIFEGMFLLLSNLNRSSPREYLDWALFHKTMLHRLKRSEDTLVIDEQCWDTIRRHLSRVQQTDLILLAQSTAWTLYKHYNLRELHEQARKVRVEYAQLADEYLDVDQEQMWWPDVHGTEVHSTTQRPTMFEPYERLEMSAGA